MKAIIVVLLLSLTGCATSEPSAEQACVNMGATPGTRQFNQCVAVTRSYQGSQGALFNQYMDQQYHQDFPTRTVCSDDGMGGVVCVTR